ncbi:trafficking protein particle complex subunit 1-like isoform X2 [Prunus yedoensis var. nudiflora]|uniref:Trafficking protein particle complex subunit 1-like isoform X2 n=1 Tax=Prunus yedoensis var. nudiflora TaxID=2094558 RepID=A0A314ZI02_PRUYE|nr:trafficking protein particle complex subunit 1-like isoform X2 [Prunus yedoensis var. nudiflora]
MESPSGIKIILVTHPRAGDLRESLKYTYNLYVEYVVKNPLYTSGTPIRVPCTSGMCTTPLHATSSQLIASDLSCSCCKSPSLPWRCCKWCTNVIT